MPVIITKGAATAQGFGFSGGKGLVISPNTSVQLLSANSYTGASSVVTPSILSGYSASARLYLVGDGGQAGNSCCGNCGRSSSGENMTFLYQFLGDETSMTLHYNINGQGNTSNSHKLTVNGGLNNGKFIRVGSFGQQNSYGNGCPPPTYAYSGTLPGTLETYGAYADSGGNYYNDDYYYGPCGSSFGNGQYSQFGYGAAGGCGTGYVGAFHIQYLNNY